MTRQRKCKICRTYFTPRSISHKCCGVDCALELAKIDREKKERKAHRADRVRMRSRAEWLKLAQTVMNQYVRLRDKNCGCVSCNRPANWTGQWHASHFRSVGAASAIRFNLWNINKSCSICNNWKSGNLSEYEPLLRAKIGNEKVDWLRTQNQIRTYSIEYLERLIRIFKKKIKLLTIRR